MINLIRCDDRLIHGQCMTRIVQHYKINRIVVVDDFTASNPTMRFVIEKIAMPGIKNIIYSVEEMKSNIQQYISDDVGTLIVFRFPTIAKILFDSVEGLPTSLMIGPVQSRENTKEVQGGTYITKEEADDIDYLHTEKHVEVYFQVVPDMPRHDWANIRNKFL